MFNDDYIQGLTEMAVNMVMQEIENPGNLERLPTPLEECIRFEF